MRKQLRFGSPCSAARPLLLAALLLASCTGAIGGEEGPATDQPSRPVDPPVGTPTAPGVDRQPPPTVPAPPPSTAPAPPAPGTCGVGAAAPVRLWRLSDEQHAAAIRDLLPGVTVAEVATPGRSRQEFVSHYDRFPIAGPLVTGFRQAAKSAAEQAVRDLPALLACAAGQAERACAEAFVERFATRAFRRALDATERQALLAVYAQGRMESPAAGVSLVIEAVLQAPSFLYRAELGSDAKAAAGTTVELSPSELASSLSFLLLGSGPDDELAGAAQDGSLARPEGLSRQVDRLLRLPRAQAHLGRVVLAWMGVAAGVTGELPREQYPDFDAAMRQSLHEEARRTTTAIMASGRPWTELLTGRATFVDERLAKLYGVPYKGPGFVEAMLPAERAGVLTQGALLSSLSGGHRAVHRGLFVRKHLLCGTLGEPPVGVATAQAEGDLTQRQLAGARAANASCAPCHALIDPPGLAFESFDGLGRYRQREKDGSAVDASGELRASDVDGSFRGARDLAMRLAGSPQVAACLATQVMSYAYGRAVAPEDVDLRCEIDRLTRKLQDGPGRLVDLFAEIATSKAFRTRVKGE